MLNANQEGGENMTIKGLMKDLGLCIVGALPVFLYAVIFMLI